MSKSIFITSGHFVFGFGDRDVTFEELGKLFPHLSWSQLKQTHSNLIVESKAASASVDIPDSPLVEADAHFTTATNLGLIVKTADCVPVLIACESTDLPRAVCAIHAGWRGVRAAIVEKSVEALLERGYAPTRMTVKIGPHIRKESFEVGLDVAKDMLEAAMSAGVLQPRSVVFAHPNDASKRRIDLELIVRHQLMKFQISSEQIETCPVDTMTSSEWSSFRRDAAKAGRNLSFAAISETVPSATE